MTDRPDVDPYLATGEWIRHAPHRAQLLGRSLEPTDGRWQLADTVRGLYLARDVQTAVAEWYRLLAELGIPPARRIPHDHHLWRLELELADLSTPDRLSRMGLEPPHPSRRTWVPYQAVGLRLFEAGWRGLVAPSAARPHGLVACIFDAGHWPPEGCEPIRRVELTEIPPPPTGLTI